MSGTLHAADDRQMLRFERQLAHPAEKVWKALTEPGQLGRWFPANMTIDLRPGGAVSFDFGDTEIEVPEGIELPEEIGPMEGRVMELDPPHLLAYTWGNELLRWELHPDERGCLLVFTHTFDDPTGAARNAAGWHVCLDRLASLLGETARLSALHKDYAKAFAAS